MCVPQHAWQHAAAKGLVSLAGSHELQDAWARCPCSHMHTRCSAHMKAAPVGSVEASSSAGSSREWCQHTCRVV